MRTSHAARAAFAAAGAALRATLVATPAVTLVVTAAIASLGLAPRAAWAQTDAFSAEVAVADRGVEERSAAYAAALRRVLLDNAPDRTLMNRDDVRAALGEAEAYVETFSVEVPEPGAAIAPDTPVTDRVRRSGEAVALVRVRFARDRVLALIDAAGAAAPAPTARAGTAGDGLAAGAIGTDGALDPVRAERAFADVDSVLVWLLIEDGERRIAGGDPAALKVRERVREIAGGAGATVAFGDADGLDPGALAAFDVAAIEAASLRYATDATLVGRLSRGPLDAPGASAPPGPEVDARAGGAGIDLRGRRFETGARDAATGWRGEWLKLAPAAPAPEAASDDAPSDATGAGASPAVALATETRGVRLDDALREGLDWLLPGALGGAGYAYGGRGDSAEGLVWVGSIDSVDEYARTMALFESVGAVESVYPRGLADGAGVFVVRPRRALDAIATAAAATDWLRRGAPPVELGGLGDRAGAEAGLGAGAPDRSGARAFDRRGGPAPSAPRAREGFAGLARQADLAFDVLP